MDWLKVSDIHDKTRIPENTIRRHIKLFNKHFKGKQFGKAMKYAAGSVELIKKISVHYQSGLSTEEIKERLQSQEPQVIEVDKPQHHHITTTIQLQQAMMVINQSYTEINEKLDRQGSELANIKEVVEARLLEALDERLEARDKLLLEAIRARQEKKKPLFRRLVEWWRG